MTEFQAWPKTTRLFRDIVITEKIDGTNAAVIFEDGRIAAQSRKRLITPDDDNFGFARWAYSNAADLYEALGDGIHFGEWWGQGIQRNYGQTGRRFSLFNTALHGALDSLIGGVPVRSVPVLYEGVFDQEVIEDALYALRIAGSAAARGFRDAEGVCVFHSQSRIVQKVTLDNQDKGKWEHE